MQWCSPQMAVDLVIDIENTPGALARVAAAISDAGVNIAAATCVGPGERAELHILVPHAEAVKHALAISHVAVTRERQVVVVEVEDRPGVLANIADVLGRNEVSVRSVVQRGLGNDARLVMVMHECPESQFFKALAEMGTLDFMRAQPRAIRVIEEEFV